MLSDKSIVGRLNGFVAFAFVIAFLGAAGPAYANSSASTDIAAPLRAAQAARKDLGASTDEQFQKLFSSWQSLDKAGGRSLAAARSAGDDDQNDLTATARAPTAASFVATPFGQSAVGGVIMPMRAAIPSRAPLIESHMTSEFGMREHPILGVMRQHTGVDLAAPVGTPVHATADGIVGKAEWFGGYGLFVALEHGGGIETRYGHMSRLNVAAGDRVRKGDIVGYVGTTGRSTGPHLHYEVRVGAVAVNPLPYMQADNEAAAPGAPALIAVK